MSGEFRSDGLGIYTDFIMKVFKKYTDNLEKVFLKKDSNEKVCIFSIQTIWRKSSSYTDYRDKVFFDEDSSLKVCINFEDNWIGVCIFENYS